MYSQGYSLQTGQQQSSSCSHYQLGKIGCGHYTSKSFSSPNSQPNKKLLKPLFFAFGLDKIIEETPKSCLICASCVPKYLKHQIGIQRSATFDPGEHLVIDSAYMNTSKEQFSKMLVLVDQCTSRLSALPLRNLKSPSVLRMLQFFLCCNTHPRQIFCDLGSEYFDKFRSIPATIRY